MEARFTTQGLGLEQIMNRLDVMAVLALPVPNEQNMPELAVANPPVPPTTPIATLVVPLLTHRRARLRAIWAPKVASI